MFVHEDTTQGLGRGWGWGGNHQGETGGTVWELIQGLEQFSFPTARVKRSVETRLRKAYSEGYTKQWAKLALTKDCSSPASLSLKESYEKDQTAPKHFFKQI